MAAQRERRAARQLIAPGYWDEPADLAWLRGWREWAPALLRSAIRSVPAVATAALLCVVAGAACIGLLAAMTCGAAALMPAA